MQMSAGCRCLQDAYSPHSTEPPATAHDFGPSKSLTVRSFCRNANCCELKSGRAVCRSAQLLEQSTAPTRCVQTSYLGGE